MRFLFRIPELKLEMAENVSNVPPAHVPDIGTRLDVYYLDYKEVCAHCEVEGYDLALSFGSSGNEYLAIYTLKVLKDEPT